MRVYNGITTPRTINEQTNLLENFRSIIINFVKNSKFNVAGGYAFSKVNVPLLRSVLVRSTGLKVLADINELAIKEFLERHGYIVIAHGSDGANSSWILAIDPRDPYQVASVKALCKSQEVIEEILRDPNGFVARLMYSDLPATVKKILEEKYNAIMGEIAECQDIQCVRDATMRLALLVFDEITGIGLYIANTKLRVVNRPCDIVRRLEGGGR